MREPNGAGGVIVGNVFCAEQLVYQTSSVQYSHGHLSVTRLDEDDPRLVSYRGPNFSIPFPSVSYPKRDRLVGFYEAHGKNSLGSVSFVNGAAARDGTETFDLTDVNAQYAYSHAGLDATFDVVIGEPHLETFCSPPPRHSSKRYVIQITVPFAGYMRFFNVSDPAAREFYRRNLAEIFGSDVAKTTEHDD